MRQKSLKVNLFLIYFLNLLFLASKEEPYTSAGSQKQLLIFWHFFDRLCQQARADNRKVCVINLDDTAANRCATKSRGYVTQAK